jgi:hypothetical protein
VSRAIGRGSIADEELSAPRRPVRSQTEAVERDADHSALQSVFGHHRGDVGMVVLNREGRHRELLGEARREEVGMQVVRHELGLEPEQTLVPLEGRFE